MTPSRSDTVAEAIRSCQKLGGDGASIANLRRVVSPLLTERLTVMPLNGIQIDSIIQDAMERFASSIRDIDEINWKAWLLAIALSLASERVGATRWLDTFTGRFSGAAWERRALVIMVILTLDGPCQWALLNGISKLESHSQHAKCERTLRNSLANL